MGFPVPHARRSGVHRLVNHFSKIWTHRPRPWGARFTEISPFENLALPLFTGTFWNFCPFFTVVAERVFSAFICGESQWV